METTPLAKKDEIQYSPISGTIKNITLHFPPGCSSLVEVFVYHIKKQILPVGRTGVALDDATEVFHINEQIKQGDAIQVTAINHDDTYPHTVTILIYIGG